MTDVDETEIESMIALLDRQRWSGAPRTLGLGLDLADERTFFFRVGTNAVARPGAHWLTRNSKANGDLLVVRTRPCRPGDFGVPRLRKHALEVTFASLTGSSRSVNRGQESTRIVQYNGPSVAPGMADEMSVVVHQNDGQLRDDDSPRDFTGAIWSSYAMPFTDRYEWSVVFQQTGGGAIRVGTTPHAALVLFRDRDKPPAGRRSPLVHWVRAHQRVRGETHAEVRAHIRGNERFAWHDFAVRVVPSPFDLELAQRPPAEVL